jgi:hypothetical protein
MSFDWSKHATPNGAWVKFDNEGDKVVGRILNIREHIFDSDKGPVPIIDLDTGEEEPVSLSCAAVNLRGLMAELAPQAGDRIGVKLIGHERLPGRPQPLKKFDVRILEKAPTKDPEPEFSDEPF